MPVAREPNLPAKQSAVLVEIVELLDRELRAVTPQRDPRIDQLMYLGPTQQLVLIRDLVGVLARACNEFKNGATLQRGAEPTGWQGSAAANSDETLVARFAAGDPHRAAVARSACATWDSLHRSGAFGLTRISKESFIRSALTGGMIGS
jgi:hypothetical protein